MNWTEIKEKYPKAFYDLKKTYLLYEMTHHGDILLMVKIEHDQITNIDKFESFNESLLVYYFKANNIEFSKKFSVTESFNYGFEELEKEFK